MVCVAFSPDKPSASIPEATKSLTIPLKPNKLEGAAQHSLETLLKPAGLPEQRSESWQL